MLSTYTVLLIVLTVNVSCQSFYLYRDSVGTLDESQFENIKNKSKIINLDVRGSGIVRVLDTAFQGFDNVNFLALGQNSIECLPEDVFHGVQNVEFLTMYLNKLKYLHKNTFSNLRKMISLDLDHNLLTKLEVGLFDNNVALKRLEISNNLLTHIPEGIFSKLNNLRILYLSSNYIHHIERNSMPSAVPTNLEQISLWLNKLETVDIYDSTLNSLKVFHIYRNPLYCDCKLKRLYKIWAATFRGSVWEPTCDGPENLKNKDWTTLQESDFACERNVVQFNSETNKFPRIGENLVLACRVNLPVGDISITYKNGTNVVEHLRRRRRFPSIQSDSSEENSWYKLTIKDVQAYDAGSYVCVVNGKAEKEFYLTVDDPSYYEKCLANV